MTKQTNILNLSYKDFQNLALQTTREDNHLDLVESWQENILNSEFSISEKKDYYAATIYFIVESYQNGYFLKRYSYSYLANHSIFFKDDYSIIDQIALKKIAKLESLVEKSEDKDMWRILKSYKSE